MPRPSAYSPSRLAVFQRCPRRYYWQYVVRAPRRRSAEQSVGIALHGALEAVQQAGGVGEIGIAGALASLAERWEGEGFATPEAEAEARAAAESALRAYLARRGDGAGTPVMIEQRLKGTLDELPLVGVVDRVDRLPDGALELIDYKSGRSLDEAEVGQQLAIYRHLVATKTGQLPARVSIHRLDGEVVPWELPEDGWRALLARAAETARAIAAEEDFEPRVGEGCARCDYASRCLAWQRVQR